MRNPFSRMTFLNPNHSWTRSFSARVRGFRKGSFDRDVGAKRRRRLKELEASEACTWLRAAGFPQYAQLYEDGLFPIELTSVEVDHDFLDSDSIQPLYRRLNTLNKCALLKVEAPSRKVTDDSDEEDQCALSDKWKYLRTSRRWSRKDLDIGQCVAHSPVLRSASSHDSLLTDQDSVGMTGDVRKGDSRGQRQPNKMSQPSTLTTDSNQKMKRSTSGSFIVSPRLRRAASERIKSARNLLKRVESFKRSRSRKAPTNISQISQPVIVDSKDMQAKIQHLNCKEITPCPDTTAATSPEVVSSPELPRKVDNGTNSHLGFASASSEDMSDNSRTSPELGEKGDSKTLDRPKPLPPADLFTPLSHTEMDSSTQAISTAARAAVENRISRRSNRISHFANSPELPHHSDIPLQTYYLPQDYIPGSFPKELSKGSGEAEPCARVRLRTVSGSPEVDQAQSATSDHRASVYDNVLTDDELAAAHKELDIILHELFQDINGLSHVLNSSEPEMTDTSESTAPLVVDSDDSLPKPSPVKDEVSDGRGSLSSPGEGVTSTWPQDGGTSQGETGNVSLQCEFGTVSSQGEFGTVSSQGEFGTVSSQGECGTVSSHNASEIEGSRERRDSGVGSSLTRAPSDRRRTRIRWHSFQKSHRPSFNSRSLQIIGFSAGQLMVLKKLAMVKLTAIMEKYSPVNRTGWNWVVNRLMKRPKTPDYKDKNIFGVPLLVTLQRSGQPIPQCLLYAMRFLRKTSKDAVGIFRKSGVRSRIQKLRNDLEQRPDQVNFVDELQAYDVADLLKQYFRELPECLLTNKLSETFISIFTYVPPDLRLEALQSAVILMPDENREVLQSLLLFLSDISLSSDEHQMTASNLAVCFAPSLFAICGTRSLPPTASPRMKRSNNKGLGVPDQRELLDQKAAHECLTMMIVQCKQLFMISAETLTRCRFSYMEEGEPVSLEELCKTDELSAPDITNYVDSCIKGILKEAREKFKSWTALPGVEDVDLSYKKVGDGHPLRLWRCSVEVEAPPTEVLNRILSEQYLWDEDLLQWKTVEKINNQTDVFQYVRNSMAPHPTRDYCVLRSWRTDLAKGACVLVSTSIDHPGAPLLGGVRGVVLASRYLIEPCGSGKSRLTHLSRIDVRGKGPEWYSKVYGHICSNFMCKIKASFTHGDNISEGPETKV
ncbi:rho GTPase-activating protein 7-like isoform X2 [Liolophura sinensis]|uniref:rho GTPase-activating protein 7-like isoform X2 n=1 Tax=Liolophura sinensis TaxID=3198878 RepID=UPI0031583A25